MSRDIFCAKCEHFPIKDDPELAAQGMGRCSGFEGSIEPHEKVRRWDDSGCVIFGLAPDMQARMNWIARKRREESGGNAAAA